MRPERLRPRHRSRAIAERLGLENFFVKILGSGMTGEDGGEGEEAADQEMGGNGEFN
jgi:hypothetical protein